MVDNAKICKRCINFGDMKIKTPLPRKFFIVNRNMRHDDSNFAANEKNSINMSSKESLFNNMKECARRNNQPFPYNSFEEWLADAKSREPEIERNQNKLHYWLADYPPSPDNLTYRFHDPTSGRLYSLNLNHGSTDQCWSVELSYDNGEPDGWYQWLSPDLCGCYAYDDLPILKMDLIQMMQMKFPEVEGWNDDFHYSRDEPVRIHYQSPLYPREFFRYFHCDIDGSEATRELFALGNISLLRRPPHFTERVAIIGSRKPDEMGLEIAYKLGQYHSSEIVVSGLARGIDTAVHRGCLDAGGKTIAVVGSGLDIVHPKENSELQNRIIDGDGMILSEQTAGTKANPRTLIARTRLQMAFADKVVVVECEKESGTMHAINFARQFRKPIFALDCDWSGNRFLIDNGIARPFWGRNI